MGHWLDPESQEEGPLLELRQAGAGLPQRRFLWTPETTAQTQGGWREVRGEPRLAWLAEALCHPLSWTAEGHGRGPAAAG